MTDTLLTAPALDDSGSALITPADMLARSGGLALISDDLSALVSQASIVPLMMPKPLIGPDDAGPPAGGKFTIPVTIAFG